MASDFPSQEQLGRYLDGELSPDEAAYVRTYLEAHPGRRGIVAGVLAAARGEPFGPLPDHTQARRRFLDRLAVETAAPPDAGPVATTERGAPRTPFGAPPATMSRGGRRWMPVAIATAAIAIVAGVTLRPTIGRHTPSSPGQTGKTVATAIGQRATITLTDGSQIMIAPQSRLTVASDFGSGTRQVTLEGEAYFIVRSAAGSPFVVRTGPITTRVLGTAFDVRRYADDRTTQVAVVTGRVATGGVGHPAVLAAGMVGQAADSSVTVNTTDDPSHVVSWTQGRLVFKNAPVPEVLAALGRWYGYEFRLSDTTRSALHINAEFRIDQPTEMMNTVKGILGVTMTFEGHVVTLQPVHPRARAAQRDPRHESFEQSTSEVGK